MKMTLDQFKHCFHQNSILHLRCYFQNYYH